MIKTIPDLPVYVIGFELSGEISAADYGNVIVPAIEAAASGHHKLRLLYYVTSAFEKFDFGAMWQDTKVGLEHMTLWAWVAVVSDVSWIQSSVKVFGFAMPSHVRTFPDSGLAEAKQWLSE